MEDGTIGGSSAATKRKLSTDGEDSVIAREIKKVRFKCIYICYCYKTDCHVTGKAFSSRVDNLAKPNHICVLCIRFDNQNKSMQAQR